MAVRHGSEIAEGRLINYFFLELMDDATDVVIVELLETVCLPVSETDPPDTWSEWYGRPTGQRFAVDVLTGTVYDMQGCLWRQLRMRLIMPEDAKEVKAYVMLECFE